MRASMKRTEIEILKSQTNTNLTLIEEKKIDGRAYIFICITIYNNVCVKMKSV